MPMRLPLLAFLLGGTVLPVDPGSARTGEIVVEIRLFQFQPDSIEVPSGTRVHWTNRDDIEHTVTAGDPDSASGAFSGSLPGRGAGWDMTFEQPGRFDYFCDRHHFMRGTIRVTSTRKAGP